MENIAAKLYESLDSLSDIERLISNGEAEGQYLECKSLGTPRLDRGSKQQLAESISAFANTGGGVIIWGVSTTKHAHSGLDVLSQIEEIGSIRSLKNQIDLETASVFEPQMLSCESKFLTRTTSDTRGIVITFVPPTSGDPIRSTIDGKFYIRVRDKSSEMPYETIKRMFAGALGPDLHALFDSRLVRIGDGGSWEIPIILSNNSSAVAKDTQVVIEVINKSSCDHIDTIGLLDQSSVNPGKRIFMSGNIPPIFKGKREVIGRLVVRMKKQKISKRKLDLKITIFSTNMRGKTYKMNVQLAKKGFSVKKIQESYLY